MHSMHMRPVGRHPSPSNLQLWSHCHKPGVRTELLCLRCCCWQRGVQDVYQLCLMCLGAFAQEAASAMTAELPAVLLVRQHAERVLGLAEGKHGNVLVTVQGDGVITYSAAREVSCRHGGSSSSSNPHTPLEPARGLALIITKLTVKKTVFAGFWTVQGAGIKPSPVVGPRATAGQQLCCRRAAAWQHPWCAAVHASHFKTAKASARCRAAAATALEAAQPACAAPSTAWQPVRTWCCSCSADRWHCSSCRLSTALHPCRSIVNQPSCSSARPQPAALQHTPPVICSMQQ